MTETYKKRKNIKLIRKELENNIIFYVNEYNNKYYYYFDLKVSNIKCAFTFTNNFCELSIFKKDKLIHNVYYCEEDINKQVNTITNIFNSALTYYKLIKEHEEFKKLLTIKIYQIIEIEVNKSNSLRRVYYE